MRTALQIVTLLLLAAVVCQALNNGLGRTPQMGWNSWNRFNCGVNETVILGAAKAMVSSGMQAAGYHYINIDDCWSAPERLPNGSLTWDPTRFPNGIPWLAAQVHAMGLGLGIYGDAGQATCQGRPGFAGYECLDAMTFAEWGIDYLKEDWCHTVDYQTPQYSYSLMRDCLQQQTRPIFFSMCDWGVGMPWLWAMPIGNSWRTTGDINDSWDRMVQILSDQIAISNYSGPGGWNDPDMLEVGNGGMTDTEYRSHFSLWAMLAAPLIAGNDLATMSDATLAILTAPEVIAVDQDALGRQAALAWQVTGPQWAQAWSRPLADGSTAVAVVNLSPSNATLAVPMTALGFTASQTVAVRDLWLQQDVGSATGQLQATLESHATLMVKLTA